MQCDTTALQISKGPPRKLHTLKGETADCTGLSLTLPKSYLATFKLVTNRWAWELVPERLAGSRSRKHKGRYPWQPWKREPPKGNLSLGAWRTEGPENRVTWNLQSPNRPQAPSPTQIKWKKEQQTPDHADIHLILQVREAEGALKQRQDTGIKRRSGWPAKPKPLLSKMAQEPKGYLAMGQVRCAAGQMAWQ